MRAEQGDEAQADVEINAETVGDAEVGEDPGGRDDRPDAEPGRASPPGVVDAGDGRGEYVYRRRSVVRRLGRAGVRPLVDLARDMKGLASEAWAAAAPPDDESTAEKYPGWVRGWGGKALIVVGIVVVFIGWWLVMGWML